MAGVAYITAALILASKLGAASFIVCVIAGQMLTSMLIDHYGLMGLTPKPAGAWRAIGVTLILLGMVVVQINRSPAGSASGPASSAGRS
ncbi:DMT family transporter [Pseudomonas aeruginosa]|uniref:DMT family transporter n=1 Tax=Pseudomonas aeruginosa TaxID=287 RepID=UPI00192DC931|nr:DMT family transporter [Pseudomonas aeruginosa]